MGIKKLLKLKPPEEETPDQNRETLQELGISTKNIHKKQKNRFAAYGQFAKDRIGDKFFAPPGYEQYAPYNELPSESQNDHANDQGDTTLVNQEKDQEHHHHALKLFSKHKSKHGNGGCNSASTSPSGDDPYAVNTDACTYYNEPYKEVDKDYFNMLSSGPTPSSKKYVDPYEPQVLRDSNTDLNASEIDDACSIPNGKNYTSLPSRLSGTENTAIPYTNPSLSSRNVTPPPNSMNYESRHTNPYAILTPDKYTAATTTTPRINSNPGVSSPLAFDDNPYTRASEVNRSLSKYIVESDGGLNQSELHLMDSTVENNEDDLNVTMDGIHDDYGDGDGDGDDDVVDLNETIGENNLSGWQLQEQIENEGQEQTSDRVVSTYHPEKEAGSDHGGYGTELNPNPGYQTFEQIQREEEARQQEEEDEEVDQVKQQIRYTKQSSVASTRNTLKMAHEAEMAGMNTMGMLGHQSEVLNNTERNLDLIKVQNSVAEDKVEELKKINRSIFAVHAKNPFNSKRRQMEREEKIRNEKVEQQLMMEETNKRLTDSTNRVAHALDDNGKDNNPSLIQEKYKRQEILKRAKQYQFENDKEDDEMEVELDKNLDKIGQISSRLKNLAIASGEEVQSQTERLKNMEENTDTLDIKLQMNTSKLAGIR
ncbi:Sec9p NDAI_0D03770 [Naumovozyma dairenensis CBS 421]|uniref:t-SNARE coiled-coil homology domain-containing protein n=1 Tax=Naumovozyma dairenensis (strain ATCC 10597 / BCRC 20456 / CBS 421 / NBRC 0211 / NRRL Y-12639) TaxID=1071378 RepID=G0WA80_NAUDC|nr:hypothetical protein NDAI_0D03770 [Naumovozyma dairenensis CBS 421]CCD24691.1 hypothetical protein NDAI_0D03770 [Naumovozyma dairenensis CBS 421]